MPVGNIVQAFPEVKSVSFADTAFLPDLSLQELLAVFREKKVPLSLRKHCSTKFKIKETTQAMWLPTKVALGKTASDRI